MPDDIQTLRDRAVQLGYPPAFVAALNPEQLAILLQADTPRPDRARARAGGGLDPEAARSMARAFGTDVGRPSARFLRDGRVRLSHLGK